MFLVFHVNLKCPLKKTQSSCPGSRDLNRSGKGLNRLPISVMAVKSVHDGKVTYASDNRKKKYSKLIWKLF
jgi:hypothetical protein